MTMEQYDDARLARAIQANKANAMRLLVHYFTLAGAVKNSDNVAEIEEIVEHIFDAAVQQAERERKAPEDAK